MKRLMLCLFALTLTFSCTETDTNTPQINQTEDNFFALNVGNSWVYKNYKYNSATETYDDTGVIDSISIVATQEILGDTYFKFRRLTTGNEQKITFCNENGEHFEFLRAFEGNLINEEGAIKFTNNNYEERLVQEHDWGSIFETLVEGESSITVEAGVFTCMSAERYAKTPEGEPFNGLDHFYYADGYGLIYDTSSFISESTPSIIRRLDAYELQ